MVAVAPVADPLVGEIVPNPNGALASRTTVRLDAVSANKPAPIFVESQKLSVQSVYIGGQYRKWLRQHPIVPNPSGKISTPSASR